MKLGDVVWRSALRNRAAREVEIGGGGGLEKHVFEVTDLTIPAGTDWGTGIPNYFGDSVEVEIGRTYIGGAFIHLAAPLGGALTLGVTAYEITGDNGDFASAYVVGGAGTYYAFSKVIDNIQTADGPTVDIVDGQMVEVRGALRMMSTPSAFLADTHIIRARAELLIL